MAACLVHPHCEKSTSDHLLLTVIAVVMAGHGATRRSIDASSVFSNDDYAEYDFVSEGHRSLESSIADLGLGEEGAAEVTEPAPSQTARAIFGTPSLSAEDIQEYVQKALGTEVKPHKTVRVYADGLFDPFNAG